MDNFSNQRRCPKCGGNLYIDRDHYGWYEQCLQCSFTRNLRVGYQDEKEVVFIEADKLELSGHVY